MRLYIHRMDWFWETRGVWTILFKLWTIDKYGQRKDSNPIIQDKHTVNRIVRAFKAKHPEGKVMIKDTATRNENLGI